MAQVVGVAAHDPVGCPLALRVTGRDRRTRRAGARPGASDTEARTRSREITHPTGHLQPGTAPDVRLLMGTHVPKPREVTQRRHGAGAQLERRRMSTTVCWGIGLSRSALQVSRCGCSLQAE